MFAGVFQKDLYVNIDLMDWTLPVGVSRHFISQLLIYNHCFLSSVEKERSGPVQFTILITFIFILKTSRQVILFLLVITYLTMLCRGEAEPSVGLEAKCRVRCIKNEFWGDGNMNFPKLTFRAQRVHIHCRIQFRHICFTPLSLSLSLSLFFSLPPSLTHKLPNLSLSLIPPS